RATRRGAGPSSMASGPRWPGYGRSVPGTWLAWCWCRWGNTGRLGRAHGVAYPIGLVVAGNVRSLRRFVRAGIEYGDLRIWPPDRRDAPTAPLDVEPVAGGL